VSQSRVEEIETTFRVVSPDGTVRNLRGMALELERWILLRHRSSVTSYTWAHVESLISSLPDDDIRSDLRRDFCRLTEDGDLDHV
jgi:hypothetical protein